MLEKLRLAVAQDIRQCEAASETAILNALAVQQQNKGASLALKRVLGTINQLLAAEKEGAAEEKVIDLSELVNPASSPVDTEAETGGGEDNRPAPDQGA